MIYFNETWKKYYQKIKWPKVIKLTKNSINKIYKKKLLKNLKFKYQNTFLTVKMININFR